MRPRTEGGTYREIKSAGDIKREGPRVLGKEDQGPSSWGDRHEAKYMETLENALRGHTIIMTIRIY